MVYRFVVSFLGFFYAFWLNLYLDMYDSAWEWMVAFGWAEEEEE